MAKLTLLEARHPPSASRKQLMTTLGASRSPQAALPSEAGEGSPQTLTLSSVGVLNTINDGSAGRLGNSTVKHLFVKFCNKHQETLARKAKEALQRDYSTLPAR